MTSDDERSSWDYRKRPPQYPLKVAPYAERKRALREIFAKFPELRKRYGDLLGGRDEP